MGIQLRGLEQKLSRLALFVAGILFVANLVVSNIFATTGDRLRNLEKRRDNLTNQNAIIREEIIRQSSFMAVEDSAHALGFADSVKTVTLTPEPAVAMGQP